jgi:hypothetical protein
METSSIPISCILQNKNNDSYDFPNFYLSNQIEKYYFKELWKRLENYKIIELDYLQNECLALMVEFLTNNSV